VDYNCTTEQWRHTCPETDKYKGGSEVIRRVRRRGAITGGTRFLQRPATWDLPRPLLDRCASLSDAQQELRAPVDGVLLRVVRVLLCGWG
jgi:hypothetical protein